MTGAVEAVFDAVSRLRQRDAGGARRLRIEFLGTSNQRSAGAAPRALGLANAFALQDLVTETPGRLDYFDALRAFRDADALLLLGTSEAHYTPSRIFAALNSNRPLLALYHADSPVTDLLRRFGGPPSVRLITYDDVRPARSCVEELCTALGDLARQPAFDPRAVDRRVLSDSSAAMLAGRLAGVFQRVSAAEGAPA